MKNNEYLQVLVSATHAKKAELDLLETFWKVNLLIKMHDEPLNDNHT